MAFDKTENAKRYQAETRVVSYVAAEDKAELATAARKRGVALSRLVYDILSDWLRVARQ